MGKTHTLNILNNKELKLAAIVDANPSLIEENLYSKSGNFATSDINPSDLADINKYSNLEQCLQSEDLDAISICVHTSLHYEMTKKALLHDKHVFLEKPFCLDINQAEELISLSKQKNKILMVGHVVRFMPPYNQLKQWIDSEEFGELRFLYLSRFSGQPGWGQWKDTSISGTSGGALFDLVIHDIDFASYVLGVPSEINCSYLPGKMSKHDYISAFWNYENKNFHVKIEGGNIFHDNFPFQAGYMAQFEKASILYTSLKGDVIQIARGENQMEEIDAGDPGIGFYDEIDYFAQCIISNTPPSRCTPESALQSIKLCYKHI